MKKSSNLPPGVSERDLPGNRPEDEEIEVNGLIITKGELDHMKEQYCNMRKDWTPRSEWYGLFEAIIEIVEPEFVEPIKEGERYKAEPDDIYRVETYDLIRGKENKLIAVDLKRYDIEPALEVEVVASPDNPRNETGMVECFIHDQERWFEISKLNFKRIFREV